MSGGASFEASAGEIHALLNAGGIDAQLLGDASVRVTGVAPITRASRADLAFVRDEGYLVQWRKSDAGVTLVSAPLMVTDAGEALREPGNRAVIVVPDADLALIALLSYVQGAMPAGDPERGVHPTAVVDPSATIEESASVGPYVTIGAGVTIGADTVVRAHCSIGMGASVGEGAVLRERVTLGDRCEGGPRSILHAGVAIGADGFGYRPPAPEHGHGPFPV